MTFDWIALLELPVAFWVRSSKRPEHWSWKLCAAMCAKLTESQAVAWFWDRKVHPELDAVYPSCLPSFNEDAAWIPLCFLDVLQESSFWNTKKKQTQTSSGTRKFTADPTEYDISLQSSLHNYNPTDMDTEEQNTFLEKVMLQAADDADVHEPESKATRCKRNMKTVETLIEKRREIKDLPELTAAERRQIRNSISKQIQKEIKRVFGRRRQGKTEQILLEFRGLKDIALCTTAKRRAHIARTQTLWPRWHCWSFCFLLWEALHRAKNCERSRHSKNTVTTFHAKRADWCSWQDEQGESCRWFWNCGRDVKARKQSTSWRYPEFVQRHCGGRPRNSKQVEDDTSHSHRMFCERIQTTLMSQQSPDQAASRAGYSTEDHLLTVTLMTELCSEWRSELWLGLIDFEKAFDTVEHDVLWEVLKNQGLHPDYIDIIKRLYDGQTAYVQAGAASRRFPLLRGVKQGDPVSALLFIAVMEQCFRSLKKRWKSTNRRRSGQYFGIVIDDPESPLSNLRFADDILLFANSSPDLTKMIAHLRDEAAKYGLRMHLGKTKILSNIPPEERPESLKVGATSIEVLKEGVAERYLGRKLTLDHFHATELANRISAGWAAFTKHMVALWSKVSSSSTNETVWIYCYTCCSLRVVMLDDVGGHWETPANQQEKNAEAHCGSETPPKWNLGGVHAKSDLAQRKARFKVQVDRLVRSPAKTQATDGTKSANCAVGPLASPYSWMDTMVSHKYNEKWGSSQKAMERFTEFFLKFLRKHLFIFVFLPVPCVIGWHA